MALSLDDLTAKVDNGGVTPDGLLTAEEYNTLLAAVKENAENSTDEHISSVVVENTLSTLNLESKKPVDSQGIASAIEAASNNLKERGYIYMGVATPTTKPNTTAGKMFYLAAQAGEYNNFGFTLPTDALTSLEWNGERWFAIRIADLVTPAEVQQAILDNTAKKIEKGEAMPVASEVVAEALEARDKQLENKADKTGYYPEMAVGTANNLRGRGEATEEMFSCRPSAGASDSITEKGVSTIERIKGNTIVWKQIANINEQFVVSGYICTRNDDGSVTIKRNPTITAGYQCALNMNSAFRYTSHKYMFYADVSVRGVAASTDSCRVIVYDLKPAPGNDKEISSNGRHMLCCFGTPASSSTSFQFAFFVYGDAELTIHNLQCLDLTQMFGAGNEPTAVEEFYERIPMGIDPYAYNEGELLSVNVESIVTNGFNQFNGEYAEVLPHNTYYLGGEYTSIGFAEELGGTTEEIVLAEDRLYTPVAKGYIYASGANININLSHSGVRDGEYEPYEERVHQIPEIAQYFPDGMRSAGTVYDEITENEVIQRVGVVDLGTLTWAEYSYTTDNKVFTTSQLTNCAGNRGVMAKYIKTANAIARMPSMTFLLRADIPNMLYIADNNYTSLDAFVASLQGVMLYYELAEPIVTSLPARAINLNYAVWDWGTEKAVSSKLSAPFRADIVYGFNAVDTIRTNKLDIEALMLRVAELEAKIAETSTTTMEEEML